MSSGTGASLPATGQAELYYYPELRVTVFVDLSNFRYTLQELFPHRFNAFRDYLPLNVEWQAFFDGLAYSIDGYPPKTVMYVPAGVKPVTPKGWNPGDVAACDRILAKRRGKYIRETQGLHSRARDAVTKKWITSIVGTFLARKRQVERQHATNGEIAKNSRDIEFKLCGLTSFYVVEQEWGDEKGVDTGLSVDLLSRQGEYDAAILVSGDSDYIPAVTAARKLGKQVYHLTFYCENGTVSRSLSDELKRVTDGGIPIPYHTSRSWFFP